MARKKKSNNLLFGLLGAVVLLVILAIVGKNAGWIGQPDKKQVEVAKAKKTEIIEEVNASGKVQPVIEVKISPEVSGEIIELNVEEGDSVSEGQNLLVKIRPDNYESALTRAEANLNQQRANLASARARKATSDANFERISAEYKRNKKLFEQKAISEAEWQAAESNYKVAQQEVESAEQNVNASAYMVESAQATVREAKENLKLTTIYAPVSGTVSKLNVEQGERVVGTSQMAGTELLRIADLNQMEVRVNVNENDIVRVSLGDTAEIDVDSYSHTGRKFTGVVTHIANTANQQVSMESVTEFEVRIRILNDSFKDLMGNNGGQPPFRPGMTASVDIITDRKNNILTVPLSAVTLRDPNEKKAKDGKPEAKFAKAEEPGKKEEKKQVVFIKREGKAMMVEVETGISDYDNIEILSGLQEGDEVISGPFRAVSKDLEDGDLIESKENTKKEKE
jgi:HlyD family secretion protein